MSDLNIGIVGLGWVAEAHIQVVESIKGLNVAGVCSKDLKNISKIERRFRLPANVYQKFETMLSDPDIHIIDICTPHYLHFEQALAAIRANKHVILEKPVCLTYKELNILKNEIDQADSHICVGFECRYTDQFTLIRSVINQGLLGEIHYAEVDYFHGIGPWIPQYHWNIKKKFGGSSLLTAGCHALDGMLFFIDDTVREVTSYRTHSKSKDFSPYEYDTTTLSILRFNNSETLAKVTSCIDCHQPYYFHIHLIGSEGTLLDNKFYSTKLEGLDKHNWTTLETRFIDFTSMKDHPYKKQFQTFMESINKNEPMPLTDFESAFETHRVTFAADLSAEEKRPVLLSEFA